MTVPGFKLAQFYLDYFQKNISLKAGRREINCLLLLRKLENGVAVNKLPFFHYRVTTISLYLHMWLVLSER